MHPMGDRFILPYVGRLDTTGHNSTSHRACVCGIGRSHRKGTHGIPTISGNHEPGGSRPASGASAVRLQNRLKRRHNGTMGTYIPTLGRRTADPSRMAKRNGKNRENTEIHFASRISYLVCPKARRTRPAAMCVLQRIKRHYNPEPIPASIDAGITGLSTRRSMVYETGPQEWVQPHTNPKRRRVEDGLPNPLWTLRIPGNAVRTH